MVMNTPAADVWRDYETTGVPSSGPHKVKKSEVRANLLEIETKVEAAQGIVDGAAAEIAAAGAAEIASIEAEGETQVAAVETAGSSQVTVINAAGTAALAAALAADHVYETTAAGITATANGQYFLVPGGVGAFSLYLNNAGVAVFQASYPSLAAFVQAFNGAGENVFYDEAAAELLSHSGALNIVDNHDGTFAITSTYFETVFLQAGRFVIGNRVSLAVKPMIVAAGFTPLNSFIRFTRSAGGPLDYALQAVPDQDGYYAVENVPVPALCTEISFHVDPDTSGDTLAIVACPSANTYAARRQALRPAQLPFARDPVVDTAPYRLVASRGALQAVAAPNGTEAVWSDLVAAAGGTSSSAAKQAMQQLERDLAAFKLLTPNKLLRLNMCLGDTLSAALTPIIANAGFARDEVPPSFSTWDQDDGLTAGSAIYLNTGVNPRAAGLSAAGGGLGVFCLDDAGAGPFFECVDADYSYSLTPAGFGQYILFDGFGGSGRVQTDNSLLADGNLTKGLIAAWREKNGGGRVSRNAVERQGTGYGFNGLDRKAPNAPIRILLNTVPCGGYFIAGPDFDSDDAAAMFQIMLAANTAIGRAPVADGLTT